MSVTTIEWTKRPGTVGEVWNLVTGCNKVDRGCKHCYAETMHRRLRAMGQEKYAQEFLAGAVCHEDLLQLPKTWTKPRTVFVNSMSDLFHKDVPFHFLLQAFRVMRECPAHTFLILTKRPERALNFIEHVRQVTPRWIFPPNVWLGTSANDQKSADLRVPILLKIPDVLRFLSYEPATGSVELRNLGLSDSEAWSHDALAGEYYCDGNTTRDLPRLHWVICGGESGPKADPMHPDWARKVRDDCKATGTPFFFKQWGAWQPITYYSDGFIPTVKFNVGRGEFVFPLPSPQNMKRVGKHASGHELDGEIWQQYPDTNHKTTT
jgi:protein gp37